MEIAKACLTGTVDEWQQLLTSPETAQSQESLQYIREAAQLLANDLIQLLQSNRQMRALMMSEEGQKLAISLSVSYDGDLRPELNKLRRRN
ncbi:hypothetical protein HYR54_04425 [Candidatus Acetothermia bacterium]|nr:hypothetical protein [Candidatus Acetothermia bacterium]MBI3460169.1 hypothetical protein [Candidatus Acetothermia bacterium]